MIDFVDVECEMGTTFIEEALAEQIKSVAAVVGFDLPDGIDLRVMRKP